jgi:hypothetical protein
MSGPANGESRLTARQALTALFARVDGEIAVLESALREDREPPLRETVDKALDLVKQLLRGYTESCGKPYPVSEDALVLFKAFVKGDPSLNAVRDSIRELVYYRNCIDAGRLDALPARPARMAVRTLRHNYLYLRTRCLKEDRIIAERW